jgi:RNA polymerase-binding transcription factor DksA
MTNTNNLKSKLLEEKARLEGELSSVGHRNPEIAGDWEPSAPNLNNPTADVNDVADSMEAFEGNSAIEVELEARLLEIDAALARIDAGAYGVCRICGEKIEAARLEANPSAPTCIAHREG